MAFAWLLFLVDHHHQLQSSSMQPCFSSFFFFVLLSSVVLTHYTSALPESVSEKCVANGEMGTLINIYIYIYK